jgi:hypothetical protein
LEHGERGIMKRSLFVTVSSMLLFAIAAMAQEVRNDVSVQGTGFFNEDSNSNGISRTTTKTGGSGSGIPLSHQWWLSAEANYGFDRNTQKYFSDAGQSRVQSDVHGVTADVVVNLPLHISKFSPYALAGRRGTDLSSHPQRQSLKTDSWTSALSWHCVPVLVAPWAGGRVMPSPLSRPPNFRERKFTKFTNRKIAQIRGCHNRRMGRDSFYKKGPTQRAQ